MNFTKVKPPVFIVCGEELNEYEVRQLQLDIKKGLFPSGISVKDEEGNERMIDTYGRFTNGAPKGMSYSYELSKQLLD